MRFYCSGPTMHDLRAFEEVLRELGAELPGGCGIETLSNASSGRPSPGCASFLNGQRIEFHQTEEAYFAYVSVQGLHTSSLKIKIQGGRLQVLKLVAGDAAGPSIAPSSAKWEALGSYELPEDAIIDGIFAKLQDGELFLSVPRTPEEAAVEVPIVTARDEAEEWVSVAKKGGQEEKEEA